MPGKLRLTIGQASDKGRKPSNQDFHGALIVEEPLLTSKGVCVAIADGIGSSAVSAVASESAVKSFLMDYYCTSESWTVKTSAQRVISAANSWLHAQNMRGDHRYDLDRGYVCAFSAMVFRSATAHLFHVGDCRVHRLVGGSLEQLTQDHRVVVSSQENYLGRALGVNQRVEIDYRALPIAGGDVFVLTSDGVHDFMTPKVVAALMKEHADDLDAAARAICATALEKGSPDNLTAQIVRIDEAPAGEAEEASDLALDAPAPPPLEARSLFEGYRIVRELHGSNRSHVYLAEAPESGELVVIKTPSIDLAGDRAYLRRFMMEEWIARRINSPHVLKPRPPAKRRGYLYIVTEYVEGVTLAQWMIDHPNPDLGTARDIIEQIAAGLRAFHRMEMLHQDLRPENVIIDRTGTAKIIDFGSARVAGIAEIEPAKAGLDVPGALQYAAPEYFLGEAGAPNSDLFSLGVIAYQMLTGHLPYGADVAKTRTRAQQRKLRYRPALDDHSAVPAWIDGALAKATQIDPLRRYAELSEFLYDLRHPNAALMNARRPPLLDRNPVLFWRTTTILFALLSVALLVAWRSGR